MTETKTKKMHPVKRVILIAAIVIAVCAAALGGFRIIQLNFLYNYYAFIGQGFYTNAAADKITAADLEMVDKVLDENHISHKLNEDGRVMLVQPYNGKKAIDALQNCGYEFEGCIGENLD